MMTKHAGRNRTQRPGMAEDNKDMHKPARTENPTSEYEEDDDQFKGDNSGDNEAHRSCNVSAKVVCFMFVLSLTLPFTFIYFNYAGIRRLDGIIDAVTAACEGNDHKVVRDCLEGLLLRQGSSSSHGSVGQDDITNKHNLDQIRTQIVTMKRNITIISDTFSDLDSRIKTMVERTASLEEARRASNEVKDSVSQKSRDENEGEFGGLDTFRITQQNMLEKNLKLETQLSNLNIKVDTPIKKDTSSPQSTVNMQEITDSLRNDVNNVIRRVEHLTKLVSETEQNLSSIADDVYGNHTNVTEWIATTQERIRVLNESSEVLKTNQTEILIWKDEMKTTNISLDERITTLTNKQQNADHLVATMENRMQSLNDESRTSKSDLGKLTSWRDEMEKTITSLDQRITENEQTIIKWRSTMDDNANSQKTHQEITDKCKALIEQEIQDYKPLFEMINRNLSHTSTRIDAINMTISNLYTSVTTITQNYENTMKWQDERHSHVMNNTEELMDLRNKVNEKQGDFNEGSGLTKSDKSTYPVVVEYENSKLCYKQNVFFKSDEICLQKEGEQNNVISNFNNHIEDSINYNTNSNKGTENIESETRNLNSSSQALHDKHQGFKKIVDEMQKNISDLTVMLQIVSKNLSTLVATTKDNITLINDEIEDIKSNITTLVATTEDNITLINDEIENIKSNITALGELANATKANMSLLHSQMHTLRNHQTNLPQWTAKIDRNVHDLKHSEVQGLKHNLEQLRTDHTNITEWTAGIAAETSKLNVGIEIIRYNHDNVTRWTAYIETNITAWISRFEDNTSDWVGSLELRGRYIEQDVHFSQFQSKEVHEDLVKKTSFQTLFSFLLMSVFIWMVVLTWCVNQKSLTGARFNNETDEQLYAQPYNRRITHSERVSPTYATPKTVSNAVCVIGFYTETERKHLQRVSDICSTMAHAPEVTGFTVHRHDDLASIPRMKVYVMFVDFNERNVILEDPRKGLGDLRLLTMRQLWSLGGDAMLVYCGDVGSRHLKGNDFFNRDLTSIYHHQELSRLKNQERMFSIHDRFTPYQEKHIRSIIFTNCC